MMGCGETVTQRTLTPSRAGSTPATSANNRQPSIGRARGELVKKLC